MLPRHITSALRARLKIEPMGSTMIKRFNGATKIWIFMVDHHHADPGDRGGKKVQRTGFEPVNPFGTGFRTNERT